MSISYNPGIVTNGLVLCLDAKNLRSYPGTGTNWYDVCSGNIGTMSGVEYANGYMIFDGVSDYSIIGNLASYFPSTATSMFAMVYPTSAGQIISELGQNAINSSWHDANIEITSAGAFYFSVWHGSLTNRVISSNVAFNNWYYVGWTFNGTANNSSGTLTAYINGISVGTTTLSRNAPYYNNNGLYYGLASIDTTNMTSSAYFGGRISTFAVYNTALTSDQVAQNFNATRGRYGI